MESENKHLRAKKNTWQCVLHPMASGSLGDQGAGGAGAKGPAFISLNSKPSVCALGKAIGFCVAGKKSWRIKNLKYMLRAYGLYSTCLCDQASSYCSAPGRTDPGSKWWSKWYTASRPRGLWLLTLSESLSSHL